MPIINRASMVALFAGGLGDDIMQELEEAPAAVEDIVKVAPLLVVDFAGYFLEHELGEADDNIKLGTDIVRKPWRGGGG
jgi:hypothetical protein